MPLVPLLLQHRPDPWVRSAGGGRLPFSPSGQGRWQKQRNLPELAGDLATLKLASQSTGRVVRSRNLPPRAPATCSGPDDTAPAAPGRALRTCASALSSAWGRYGASQPSGVRRPRLVPAAGGQAGGPVAPGPRLPTVPAGCRRSALGAEMGGSALPPVPAPRNGRGEADSRGGRRRGTRPGQTPAAL